MWDVQGLSARGTAAFPDHRVKAVRKPGTSETKTCQSNKPCQGTAKPHNTPHALISLLQAPAYVSIKEQGTFSPARRRHCIASLLNEKQVGTRYIEYRIKGFINSDLQPAKYWWEKMLSINLETALDIYSSSKPEVKLRSKAQLELNTEHTLSKKQLYLSDQSKK